KLIDRKRRMAVRPQASPLNDEIGVHDITTPPSDKRHDAQHFANWANANLDSAQTETLRLAYIEGLSSAEIAKTMDVPQGTVKSRLRLALVALRNAAAEER
ncbi:MAG: RNA polymerase sigma-70 factor (ECF subfamily), partial [Flavobacteriales bacterium]